jgi:hypothetical protein
MLGPPCRLPLGYGTIDREIHEPSGLRETRHGSRSHEGANLEQEPLLTYRANTSAANRCSTSLAGPALYFLAEYTRLKLFRKMVAARVPYYGQQVLPHSNLLDPHFRSQFAVFLGIGWRKPRASRPQRAAWFLISFPHLPVSAARYWQRWYCFRWYRCLLLDSARAQTSERVHPLVIYIVIATKCC